MSEQLALWRLAELVEQQRRTAEAERVMAAANVVWRLCRSST